MNLDSPFPTTIHPVALELQRDYRRASHLASFLHLLPTPKPRVHSLQLARKDGSVGTTTFRQACMGQMSPD